MKDEKQALNSKLEEMMASLRLAHEMNKADVADVYNLEDPNFPDEVPAELGHMPNQDKF